MNLSSTASSIIPISILNIEYQNRIREIRDLLYNAEETGRLIDECASIIADPAGGLSPVDADRAKWDYHPVMAMGGKAGQGLFYQASPAKDFHGIVDLMKKYIIRRSTWMDKYLLKGGQVPTTPKILYAGPDTYPSGRLCFNISERFESQKTASIQWRIAEICMPEMVQGRAVTPGKYEITPLWESGEISPATESINVPPQITSPGHKYRVRARIKNLAGYWSHWSSPIEFVSETKQDPNKQ